MAGSKEIRNKIKSVQSTRKITKAMEMVSAAKMKKAQDRMRASRPYVERALQIAMHIAKANTEYKHPFLAHRAEVKRVGAIVVTTTAPTRLTVSRRTRNGWRYSVVAFAMCIAMSNTRSRYGREARMRSCAFLIFEAATISIAFVILRVLCTLLILVRISLVPAIGRLTYSLLPAVPPRIVWLCHRFSGSSTGRK